MLYTIREITVPTVDAFKNLESSGTQIRPGKYWYLRKDGDIGILKAPIAGDLEEIPVEDSSKEYIGVAFWPVFLPRYSAQEMFEFNQVYLIAELKEESDGDNGRWEIVETGEVSYGNPSVNALYCNGQLVGTCAIGDLTTVDSVMEHCKLPTRKWAYILCPKCGAVHQNVEEWPEECRCSQCGTYFTKRPNSKVGSHCQERWNIATSRGFKQPYHQYAQAASGLAVRGVLVKQLATSIAVANDFSAEKGAVLYQQLIELFE